MLTLPQFSSLVRRHDRLVLLASLTGLAAGAGLGALTPPRYTSSAQILVNVRAPETVGQPGSVADQLAPDYLSTQTDIIRSERVLAKAVHDLGLDRGTAAARALGWVPERGPPARFAVTALRDRIKLTPSATSRVLDVKATAPNPELAAAIANAVAAAYRDESLAIQSEPARLAIRGYDRQARELRQRWIAEQARYAARQRALGVTIGDAGADGESARLVGLSNQLATAEAARATVAARADRTALPDVMADPVVQQLDQQLALAEAKRRQLMATAGPNNIDVREAASQIAALRSQIADQKAAIRSSAASAARQAETSVANLYVAVAAQKQRVIAAQGHRGELALIEQSLASIRQTYDQVMQRRAQLGVQDTVGQANATLLSAALPPVAASWPRPFLITALGLVAGLIVGLASAVATGFLRTRLDDAEDLELWSALPFIGGIGLERQPERISGPLLRLTFRQRV